MLLIDYNTEQDLPVGLFTSAGLAITGAVAADITLYYKKNGDAVWTTKVLNDAIWVEDSGGLYHVTFSAAEMDTYGNFIYFASHASGYSGNIVLITDYATEAALLQDVYDLMATKVNKQDILEREVGIDRVVKSLGKTTAQINDSELPAIYNEIAALKARIAAL